MASSASTEQWILTGGRLSSLAMSALEIFMASSTLWPLTMVVTRELEAMAEPQPKVLNLASSMMPLSLIFNCSFITSPQAGEPTMPVPTFGSLRSMLPMFRGFSM